MLPGYNKLVKLLKISTFQNYRIGFVTFIKIVPGVSQVFYSEYLFISFLVRYSVKDPPEDSVYCGVCSAEFLIT